MPYLYINLLRLFGLVELYQPTYNPRNLYFFRPKAQRRDCDDRIAAIRKSIDFNRVESYIDIGSGLGYFVFKLSELNKIKWSLGIEKDHTVCNYANSLVILIVALIWSKVIPLFKVLSISWSPDSIP